MTVTIENRLVMRQRPSQRRILYQEWRHLLFLHWKYDKEAIQKTLPKGLYVDTFNEEAYLTIVPFFIKNFRVTGLPPIPFLSNFLEVNVRTYVVNEKGIPGIWFYSLDINSLIMAIGARNFFSLPYQKAELTSKINQEILISGNRNQAHMNFEFSPENRKGEIEVNPRSLIFFLLERYVLYSSKNHELYIQRIHHYPYLISNVELLNYQSNLLEMNGFQAPSSPDLFHYCHALDVDFFPMLAQKRVICNELPESRPIPKF